MKKETLRKTITAVLYAGYALVLTLFILFGTQLAPAIKRVLTNIMYTNKISSVTLKLDGDVFDCEHETLIAGKTYSFDYTIKEVLALGPGFEFESLDGRLSVSEDGEVCASPSFDGETAQMRMRITSKYDTAFETDITLNFKKKYPDGAEVHYSMQGLGRDPEYIYVGMPLGVSVKAIGEHSGFGYTLEYDEEYFSADGGFKAIKPTPDGTMVTLVASYNNGAIKGTSQEFVILPASAAPAEFEEVQWNGGALPAELHVGDAYTFTLHNDGEELETAYTVSCSGGVSVSGENTVVFRSPGEQQVTITLPGGFKQTFTRTVSHVYGAPWIQADKTLNGNISLLDSGAEFEIHFDADVTYCSVRVVEDSKLITATIEDGYLCIDVHATKGTATLTLIVEGRDDLSTTYTMEIKEDLDIGSFVTSDWQTFLTKVMGHMALFAGLGVFSTLMFLQFKPKSKILHVVLHAVSGVFVAALTEFVQLFMPGRSGTLKDVLIDVVGFYIGTACMLLLHFVIALVKKIKAKKLAQATETNAEPVTETVDETVTETEEEVASTTEE